MIHPDRSDEYRDLLPVHRGPMESRCTLALIENIARRLGYLCGPVYERPELLQPGTRTDPDKEIRSACWDGDVPF